MKVGPVLAGGREIFDRQDLRRLIIVGPPLKIMAYENLIQLFDESFARFGDADCFLVKERGVYRPWSWKLVGEKVRALSSALDKLGVRSGDRVCILSQTRAEWTIADLAILGVGAISVPIYHSNLPDEVAYIIDNSGANTIFVEDRQQLDKVFSARGTLKSLKNIILISGKDRGDVHLWRNLLKEGLGAAAVYQKNKEQLKREALASYVYTSGTTGKPKGAVLSHGNFLAAVEACQGVILCGPADVSLLFLPLAHILARVTQFYQLSCGFTHAYAESIEKLADNIQEVQPHFLVSVPRIFEKVYERVLSQVESGSAAKQKLFRWATRVGGAYSRAKQRHEPPSVKVSLGYLLAGRLVFSKIRARLGGRIRFSVCGGAPLSKEIAEFFHAAGITILEGYGLTETTAAINCVHPEHVAFGVVGAPLKGAEEKIASDGEILVRGEMIFQGYHQNEAATREVLEPDGWFHTGDIGEFTPEGYLKITDRKKDIIVTSGGKNIAPQNIENLIKTNKYISQVVVHGDKRKYLTALITLNREEVEAFARTKGIAHDNGHLMQHPKVHQLVKEILEEKNKHLAQYETIKRFAILDHDLTQEAGELTPTLKVKRRFIAQKYADIFSQLYLEPAK